jgi:ABC-type uncharacterized transport system permease subunit
MAITHFPAMLLFSALTSIVFAVVTKDTRREQVTYGFKVFGAFVGVAFVAGWIMYGLPW